MANFNDYTVKELRAALNEAVVEYDKKARKATLVKLAEKNLEVGGDDDDEPKNEKSDDADGASITAVSVKVPKAESIDIIESADVYIRTYSKKVHGAKFVQHVKEFCGNKRDKMGVPIRRGVDSKSVRAVNVVYRDKVYQPETKILLRYEEKRQLFENKAEALIFANAREGAYCVALFK